MSKQSRAKSRTRRDHIAKRKSKGTGSAATIYVGNMFRMSDANKYLAKEALLDELHLVLCDRKVFKDGKFMQLFCNNFWATLERELAMHRSSSHKRLTALDLVVKIRAYNDKEA